MSEQTETLPSRVEATYKAREVEGVLDLYFYRPIGFLLAEFFARHGRVVRHLAERPDTHVLEIAFEVCGGGPVTARGFHVASGGAGTAEPVMDVALVGEQVFGFA